MSLHTESIPATSLDYSPADLPRPAGPTSTWIFQIALALAAVCVGYAIHIRDGEYWPEAIRWVGWGIVLCTIGVALPRVRAFSWSGRAVLVVLFAVVAVQFGMMLADSPGGSNWWSNDLRDSSAGNFRLYSVGVRLAWVFVLIALWKPQKGWGRAALGLLLATHLALGVWMIRSSPRPHNDVFVFQQLGGQALLHGDNPYNITYPDIYQETHQTDRPVYGKGLVKDGQLGFGFPYTPLSLLLSTLGYATLGDHRYAQAIAMTLAGGLIALARPSRASVLAAAGLLFTPRGLFVLGRAWTEPFVVLGLAAVVYVSAQLCDNTGKSIAHMPSPGTPGEASGSSDCPRAGRGEGLLRRAVKPTVVTLGITLGFFLGTKQYLILAVPPILLLLPRPMRPRPTILLLATAAFVALLITLPFAIWNLPAFVRSTWTVQQIAPFREDALSYLVWYFQRTGVRPGAWVAFAAAIPATALALWRAPRNGSGFAAALSLIFLVFVAFNKQAFANYYYFILAACWAAVATADNGATSTSPTRRADGRVDM
jgi:hypothetical protein